MALTGLDIYKRLPKTNCGECGTPTCLAFAMLLAQKKASLDKCPYVSEEAKAALESASAPPIRLVTIGTGDAKLQVGNETVLFRHEQTFHRPCGIAVELDDTLTADALTARAKELASLEFERVGMRVRTEMIAVVNKSGDPSRFARAAEAARETGRLLILMSKDPKAMEAALAITADRKPLIHAATADNLEAMSKLAKEKACPLAVSGRTLDELADLSDKVVKAGVQDIILHPDINDMRELLNAVTQIRRLALKRTFRPLGYPVIITSWLTDAHRELLLGTTFIAKYAGIIVVKNANLWEHLSFVTMRLNIYTDPQKPIQVEPKVYEIGTVDENSPVLVTSNFSLTYFTVEPEVEASKVPSYIVVVNTEGMSVLTSFAADKFNEETITTALKNTGIGDRVKHRKLIIPGYVSVLSGKLEAKSGWQVIVGPREASGIPVFLKTVWAKAS